MNKEYTYSETLQIIENMMISTGIRDYCTNVCHGRCCSTCMTENKYTCSKIEHGRRMACSMYICHTIYEKLALKKEEIHSYNQVAGHVYRTLGKVFDGKFDRSVYFKIMKSDLKPLYNLKFDASILDNFAKVFENIKLLKN